MLQDFLTIKPEDLTKVATSNEVFRYNEVWRAAFDERLEIFPPSHDLRINECAAEWIYTIDLDSEVFSIDNWAHFELNRVSHNADWIKALPLHEDNVRFALPRYVGEKAVTSKTIDSQVFAQSAAEYWKMLRTTVVKPAIAYIQSVQPTVNRLRWICFKIF